MSALLCYGITKKIATLEREPFYVLLCRDLLVRETTRLVMFVDFNALKMATSQCMCNVVTWTQEICLICMPKARGLRV